MAALFSIINGLISGTGALTTCRGGGGRGLSHLDNRDKILSFAEIKKK
jgi:hypothetical protein